MEIHTSTYFLLFIILFIIIILIMLFIYYMSYKPKPITLAPISLTQPSNITSPLGSTNNGVVIYNNGDTYKDIMSCNNNNTSIWNLNSTVNGRCLCEIPYYNNDCQLESYINTYITVGQLQESQVDKNIINSPIVDSLSFDSTGKYINNSCTKQCDNNINCIGIYYNSNDKTCQLLSKLDIVSGSVITYDLFEQANYYIKDSYNLVLLDRVIVYNGIKPLRYWLTNSYSNGGSNMTALFRNVVYTLTYRPTQLINTTNPLWVGLVSNSDITGNLNNIYDNPPDNVIKILPGTSDLTNIIPTNWYPIYIVFWDYNNYNV